MVRIVLRDARAIGVTGIDSMKGIGGDRRAKSEQPMWMHKMVTRYTDRRGSN